MSTTRKFSKNKWLKSANAQIEKGILSQTEVNEALEIWVNDLDGTLEEELIAMGMTVREDWLV